MSYLLDTVIVSQPDKPLPHASIMRWLEAHDSKDTFLSVMTLMEIRMGITMMPAGRRRSAHFHFLEAVIPASYAGRILPITAEIADDCGRLLGEARRAGAQVDASDALIAATARVHGLTIVTLNYKHFSKLQVPLVKLELPN